MKQTQTEETQQARCTASEYWARTVVWQAGHGVRRMVHLSPLWVTTLPTDLPAPAYIGALPQAPSPCCVSGVPIHQELGPAGRGKVSAWLCHTGGGVRTGHGACALNTDRGSDWRLSAQSHRPGEQFGVQQDRCECECGPAGARERGTPTVGCSQVPPSVPRVSAPPLSFCLPLATPAGPPQCWCEWCRSPSPTPSCG